MGNIKKISKIWQIPQEEFKQIIKDSHSIGEATEKCGIINKGRNYQTIHRRIKIENIDCGHFVSNFDKISRRGKGSLIPLEKVMVENSNYSRKSLKKRLLKLGMLENNCSLCGISPIWNKINLVMILDHINGIFNDNRIENLRLICPNCNSQLDTHCGKRNRRPKKCCIDCKSELCRTNKGGRCVPCSRKTQKHIRKITRPSKELLLQEIKNSSWVAVGEKYGVSDNSIRKWAKAYGLPTTNLIKDFNIVL
jgi:hypothetical protein